MITPLFDPGSWLAAMAAVVVGVSPAAAAQDGRICGVVLARERCGAHTAVPCPEQTSRLPNWRLRVSQLGAAAPDVVVSSAADGSFELTVPPGDYRLTSGESTLAGLADPSVVKVGAGECVRVEFAVQLLRP